MSLTFQKMEVMGERSQGNGPKAEKDKPEWTTGLGIERTRGDIEKRDQTGSPEIPDSGEISEPHGLPSGEWAKAEKDKTERATSGLWQKNKREDIYIEKWDQTESTDIPDRGDQDIRNPRPPELSCIRRMPEAFGCQPGPNTVTKENLLYSAKHLTSLPRHKRSLGIQTSVPKEKAFWLSSAKLLRRRMKSTIQLRHAGVKMVLLSSGMSNLSANVM